MSLMKAKLALPLALMVVFALSRIPGMLPQNFSAAYALAFCGGLYFPGLMAWWLPLGTLLATDILLNVFYYHLPVLNVYMLVKTLSFVLIVWMGRRFSPRMHWLRLICGGLLGAVLFYVITNTASWIYNPDYPKTLGGWIQALTSGIPGYPPTWAFFRNTLLSGGLFTALFVGAMKVTEATEPGEESASEEQPEGEPSGAETPEEAKA
jgi:hypothetical protein